MLKKTSFLIAGAMIVSVAIIPASAASSTTSYPTRYGTYSITASSKDNCCEMASYKSGFSSAYSPAVCYHYNDVSLTYDGYGNSYTKSNHSEGWARGFNNGTYLSNANHHYVTVKAYDHVKMGGNTYYVDTVCYGY